MRNVLPSGRCRFALQFAAAGSLAALMSGCSADVTRLTDPFSNPFSSASNDEASSPPQRMSSASDVIPAGRAPPVSSQALAPRSSNYASASPMSRDTTGSIEPGPIRNASSQSYGSWTTTGGTPIKVADGETADVLAKRYGVPTAALLQVNGLHTGADVRPGSHLTIPVYSSGTPRADHLAQTQPTGRNSPVRSAAAEGRWVAGPAPAPSAASAPGRPSAAASGRTAPGGRQMIAEARPSAPSARPLPMQKIAASPVAPPATLAPPRMQPAAPKVAVEPPQPAAPAPSSTVASADGSPEFRWPARGRIIQGFKGGSGGNDGINIAVPEGTSVRAAEGGVVAYAGSELKGYGNLVLIRHPNGFVSAYANNGEIDVKRGETVKRGQEIAKSGQSGNVSSPQLHFELRKGSTPVDPTQYLAGL